MEALQLIHKWETQGLGKASLLYSSAAADEEESVDLGGRQITKNKRKNYSEVVSIFVNTDFLYRISCTTLMHDKINT